MVELVTLSPMCLEGGDGLTLERLPSQKIIIKNNPSIFSVSNKLKYYGKSLTIFMIVT
jgi:hypothetical protein